MNMYQFSVKAGIFMIFSFAHIFWEGLAIPLQSSRVASNKDGDQVLNRKDNIRISQDSVDIKDVNDCLDMTTDFDALSQNQFLNLLTSDCRYDKLTKPNTPPGSPLNISIRLDIRHFELLDQQQFKLQTLIQYRYIDNRLNFERLSPGRKFILGWELVKNRIWIPHVVVAHEKDAKVMGLEGKDVFITITPQGEIFYAYRTTILIYCGMDFRKFPLDKQICRITFQSWMYNASSVKLSWDGETPVQFSSQMHLAGFVLEGFWMNELFIDPPIFTGQTKSNYSALECKFKVARQIGNYVIDYFIPSILLVCTSWITFWLQADAGPPRTTLGTCTMLSFITLASAQTKTLPKVSYIKISEIWFFVCSIFIFASLAEFAFVNVIWRRRKTVELKKVNSKYILKCGFTPRLAREEFYKSNHSLNDSNSNIAGTIKSISFDEGIETARHSISDSEIAMEDFEKKTWTTMTPHEVANWIDKKCRIVFPMAFIIFNVFFWTSALSVASVS